MIIHGNAGWVELRPEPETDRPSDGEVRRVLVNEIVDALSLQRYEEVEVLVRLRGDVQQCPRIELRPKR